MSPGLHAAHSWPDSLLVQDVKDEGRPCTPPSPFSPWAPWATNKRSFADALRSPLDQPPADEVVQPPTLMPTAAEEATLAPTVQAAPAKADDAGPFTFRDAFESGALRHDPGQDVSASLFGTGLPAVQAPAAQSSAPSLTAVQELEPENHSISMRTIPNKGAGAVAATAMQEAGSEPPAQ